MVLIGAAIKSVLKYLHKTRGERDSKWSVHYTTQKPLLFVPAKRRSGSADDLRACNGLTQHGCSRPIGSQFDASSSAPHPLLNQSERSSARRGWKNKSRRMRSSSLKLFCQSCFSVCFKFSAWRRKSSAFSDDDEVFILNQTRPVTPLLNLPTPEERMRQQAGAVPADIVRINITGESFDRQASFRKVAPNTDSLLNRPQLLNRRKTVTGIPEDVGKLDSQLVLPGQYSTVGRPASCEPPRHSGEEVKCPLRRIRAPRGRGMSSLMASLTSSPTSEVYSFPRQETTSSLNSEASGTSASCRTISASLSCCQELEGFPNAPAARVLPQSPSEWSYPSDTTLNDYQALSQSSSIQSRGTDWSGIGQEMRSVSGEGWSDDPLLSSGRSTPSDNTSERVASSITDYQISYLSPSSSIQSGFTQEMSSVSGDSWSGDPPRSSGRSIARSISLRKSKRPPPPPLRSDSLRHQSSKRRQSGFNCGTVTTFEPLTSPSEEVPPICLPHSPLLPPGSEEEGFNLNPQPNASLGIQRLASPSSGYSSQSNTPTPVLRKSPNLPPLVTAQALQGVKLRHVKNQECLLTSIMLADSANAKHELPSNEANLGSAVSANADAKLVGTGTQKAVCDLDSNEANIIGDLFGNANLDCPANAYVTQAEHDNYDPTKSDIRKPNNTSSNANLQSPKSTVANQRSSEPKPQDMQYTELEKEHSDMYATLANTQVFTPDSPWVKMSDGTDEDHTKITVQQQQQVTNTMLADAMLTAQQGNTDSSYWTLSGAKQRESRTSKDGMETNNRNDSEMWNGATDGVPTSFSDLSRNNIVCNEATQKNPHSPKKPTVPKKPDLGVLGLMASPEARRRQVGLKRQSQLPPDSSPVHSPPNCSSPSPKHLAQTTERTTSPDESVTPSSSPQRQRPPIVHKKPDLSPERIKQLIEFGTQGESSKGNCAPQEVVGISQTMGASGIVETTRARNTLNGNMGTLENCSTSGTWGTLQTSRIYGHCDASGIMGLSETQSIKKATKTTLGSCSTSNTIVNSEIVDNTRARNTLNGNMGTLEDCGTPGEWRTSETSSTRGNKGIYSHCGALGSRIISETCGTVSTLGNHGTPDITDTRNTLNSTMESRSNLGTNGINGNLGPSGVMGISANRSPKRVLNTINATTSTLENGGTSGTTVTMETSIYLGTIGINGYCGPSGVKGIAEYSDIKGAPNTINGYRGSLANYVTSESWGNSDMCSSLGSISPSENRDTLGSFNNLGAMGISRNCGLAGVIGTAEYSGIKGAPNTINASMSYMANCGTSESRGTSETCSTLGTISTLENQDTLGTCGISETCSNVGTMGISRNLSTSGTWGTSYLGSCSTLGASGANGATSSQNGASDPWILNSRLHKDEGKTPQRIMMTSSMAEEEEEEERGMKTTTMLMPTTTRKKDKSRKRRVGRQLLMNASTTRRSYSSSSSLSSSSSSSDDERDVVKGRTMQTRVRMTTEIPCALIGPSSCSLSSALSNESLPGAPSLPDLLIEEEEKERSDEGRTTTGKHEDGDVFVSVSADQMFVSDRPRTTEDLFTVIHR
ncbi:hypothetical protein JOQ06_002019 [Pogonophryne albipinna]|uniref:Uncharacterized protein n=1 Tax=Pogonophryne albipinna TaxID=1090488 RepID=A0AAD6F5G0_9TELE|nr:hypothetical protein JOQ06_002019 [Pogonophryne albipinna]